tara:strand:+ start:240 stop:914 length:675 start_codon:yes stop_codon:yes gene_type:complete
MNLSSKEKKSDVDNKEKNNNDKEAAELASLINLALEKPEMRSVALYGDVNEEKASELVYGLLALSSSAVRNVLSDPEDVESDIIQVVDPIDLYVSSYGGQATEMFSLYDIIRKVREETPIRTYGLGKVMSAGVLVLASGTRGERRVGKHCRVMIHGVVSGQQGYLADIENEFAETKFTQKMYIKALAEETNMTEKYIKNLMDKKTNVYIDAEEAVNLGIADIVF